MAMVKPVGIEVDQELEWVVFSRRFLRNRSSMKSSVDRCLCIVSPNSLLCASYLIFGNIQMMCFASVEQ
jgi:hypothetical protein